jgi:predicted dehydrogenase
MTALSSSPPLRVALIGVSGYGRVYLRLVREFQEAGRLRLVAATIINPEEEAQTVAELTRAGTRIHGSYETMLATEAAELDACLIPTGLPWHARMTIAALRAGLNVLVEKPLAGDHADALAVREAERASGRFIAVGFQDIFPPGTLALKEELGGGLIGQVTGARVIGVWPRTTAYFERNNWSGRMAASGATVRDSTLQNGLAHFVHLALFLVAPETRRAAEARLEDVELFRAHDIEGFDTAVARGSTPEGTRLWFGVSHASAEHHDVIVRVEGTQGAVEWHHEKREVRLWTAAGREIRPLPTLMDTRREMMTRFIARCRGDNVFIADSAMAEQHVKFIEALHDQGVIQTVDESWIERVPTETGELVAIRDINRYLREAYDRQACLADVGFTGQAEVEQGTGHLNH